jgi:hypothetical protein
MPKATESHILYLREFPRELTRRLKIEAAIRNCTIPQALAQILKQYFKDREKVA